MPSGAGNYNRDTLKERGQKHMNAYKHAVSLAHTEGRAGQLMASPGALSEPVV